MSRAYTNRKKTIKKKFFEFIGEEDTKEIKRVQRDIRTGKLPRHFFAKGEGYKLERRPHAKKSWWAEPTWRMQSTFFFFINPEEIYNRAIERVKNAIFGTSPDGKT
jgi:hypothetical protein